MKDMVSELEVYLNNKKELDSELLPYNDPARILTIWVLQHVLQLFCNAIIDLTTERGFFPAESAGVRGVSSQSNTNQTPR